MTALGAFTSANGLLRYRQAGPGDPIDLPVEGGVLWLQPAGKPVLAALARVLPRATREVAS